MNRLHVTDLEAAINWWRERAPSVDGVAASREVGALAEAYAHLALQQASEIDADTLSAAALDAWLTWYDATPDSPCIAICSTAQGDPMCKGCGRSFDEVQHWPALGPFEKRAVWQRITREGTAWRFNRYAERAARG
ncbi:Fe-S protein [Pelomonas sp. HMWF004]|nr:Fe-S protein [Pelomonas sp. HMWF004]